jgi:hypothetical protein
MWITRNSACGVKNDYGDQCITLQQYETPSAIPIVTTRMLIRVRSNLGVWGVDDLGEVRAHVMYQDPNKDKDL